MNSEDRSLPVKRPFSPRFAIWMIALFALALNLSWALAHAPRTHDEYIEIAQHLLAGRGYSLLIAGAPEPTSFRAPLYPLFLALLLRLSQNSLYAVTIAQSFIGAATCFPVYGLGRRLFGERIGLLAALLTALDFPLVVMSGWVLTERLYVFLIALAAYLAMGDAFRTRWRALAAGLVFGLAILTRSEAALYLTLLLASTVILSPQRALSFRNGALAALVTLVCLAPWLWRNHVTLNSWAVSDPIFVDYNLYRGAADIRDDQTEYGFNFYLALRDGRSPFDAGRRFDSPDERRRIRQEVLSQWAKLIVERPGAVIKKRLYNLYRLWIYRGEFFFTESIGLIEAARARRFANLFLKLAFYSLYGLAPALVAVAGTWMAARYGQWRASLTLWLYPLAITAMMIPLWADYRYNLPSHALLAPLVALALTQTWDALGTHRRKYVEG
jgi:4-amino-4-deoxy-L-arabinose transferase-like glycosyltransferase